MARKDSEKPFHVKFYLKKVNVSKNLEKDRPCYPKIQFSLIFWNILKELCVSLGEAITPIAPPGNLTLVSGWFQYKRIEVTQRFEKRIRN